MLYNLFLFLFFYFFSLQFVRMALSCPVCAKTYFISLSVAVVLFKGSFILVGHSCKFCGLVSAKNLNTRVCCLQVFLSGGTAYSFEPALNPHPVCVSPMHQSRLM